MKILLGKPPGPRSKKQIVEKIRIDYWDVWSMDYTLAMIIEPMLIQLKEVKHGVPGEMFILTGVPEDVYEYSEEQFAAAVGLWDEIMDKMIWSFHELNDDDYMMRLKAQHGEGWVHLVKAHEDRMQEGFDLFGKWYRALWD